MISMRIIGYWIHRRPIDLAVKRLQVLPNALKIDKDIDLAE